METKVYETVNCFIVECETEVATKLADFIDEKQDFNVGGIVDSNGKSIIYCYPADWYCSYNLALLKAMIHHFLKHEVKQ